MTTIENIYVQDLISNLKKIDIDFHIDQDETNVYGFHGNLIHKRKLENVVFTKNDKILKIANEIFFRYGGLICIMESKAGKKKNEKNFAVLHPINDEEFYQMQYQIIEYVLNIS